MDLKKELELVENKISDYKSEYKRLKQFLIEIETEMVGLNEIKLDLKEKIICIENNTR